MPRSKCNLNTYLYVIHYINKLNFVCRLSSKTNAYHRSTGYMDELAWSAAWLHKATGEQRYLQDAKSFLSQVVAPGELSWDDKSVTAAVSANWIVFVANA